MVLAALLLFLASWQSLQESSVAAYRSGDYAAYLLLMQQLEEQRPNHPQVLFNLAGAHALNGDAARTAEVLKRLAAMDVSFDLDAERDFDKVRSSPAFREAAAAMDAVRRKRVSTATIAFRFPERDLITEAIVYDPRTKSFFVSSIRKRKILRIDATGAIRDYGVRLDYAPVGMAVDADRRLLWVVTAAFERMEGFDASMKGRAALLAISLENGQIVQRIDGRGFLDSVAVARDHTVLVSDAAGTLYKLDGAELRTLVAPGRIRSPQGIAPSADENSVYVADYSGAIHRVDIRTGDALTLDAPPDVLLFGIDGLTRDGNSLIAVMNGVTLHRVVRFTLRGGGNAIAGSEILEMNTEHLDEPTSGTMARGAFYFVAASQGHRFTADSTPELSTLKEPVILRITAAGSSRPTH
ncbi:MAG: hypothetical protein ACJ74H_11180 [Thermoanaerobaculia bacterium]